MLDDLQGILIQDFSVQDTSSTGELYNNDETASTVENVSSPINASRSEKLSQVLESEVADIPSDQVGEDDGGSESNIDPRLRTSVNRTSTSEEVGAGEFKGCTSVDVGNGLSQPS